MYCAINSHVHGKNFFDGINAAGKFYLKEKKVKLIGKLVSNNTPKIGMLPIA